MSTVIQVCIIIITIAIVSFIVVLIVALQNVRRVRIKMERIMDKIEGGVDPILSSVGQISDDIRQMSFTAKRQLVRVDDTANYINKNINICRRIAGIKSFDNKHLDTGKISDQFIFLICK